MILRSKRGHHMHQHQRVIIDLFDGVAAYDLNIDIRISKSGFDMPSSVDDRLFLRKYYHHVKCWRHALRHAECFMTYADTPRAI